MQNALVRLWAYNKDLVFVSTLDKWLNLTHPTLEERLDKVREQLEASPALQTRAEEIVAEYANIELDVSQSSIEADQEE